MSKLDNSGGPLPAPYWLAPYEVPVRQSGTHVSLDEPATKAFGNCHGTVLPTRATNGDREVTLTLTDVCREKCFEHVLELVEKNLGQRITKHVVANVGVEARERA